MLRLAADVRGRRILEAECGSGPLSAALRANEAVVTGFDVSAAMVELARQRLGEDADPHVADLNAPLPFADAEFDDVVASLVLPT
ncbi:class I SAM-dependent methyltransferase [Micromonospora sp. BQ11]|uniref:class I SAM-dependent methyltransferase n=1 Tax=Micromonospora sp. BQ11 TaxID=3452212 RepID=UPI003F8BBFD0